MAAEKKAEMVRLRNVNSGAIVSVPAEKVERLGGDWEPATDTKPATKK
jgi:hypothetical protein